MPEQPKDARSATLEGQDLAALFGIEMEDAAPVTPRSTKKPVASKSPKKDTRTKPTTQNKHIGKSGKQPVAK